MNLTTITKPNPKGQLVIPKKFRDKLNINPEVFLNLTLKNNGIFITRLDDSSITPDSREISIDILKKTTGSWKESSNQISDTKREELELLASKNRKTAW